MGKSGGFEPPGLHHASQPSHGAGGRARRFGRRLSLTLSNTFGSGLGLGLGGHRSSHQPIFGVSLVECAPFACRDGSTVPYIVEKCAYYIEEHLSYEGMYRKSGDMRSVREAKQSFDRTGDATFGGPGDWVAVVSSVLKMYLRELPEPLVPLRLHEPFFGLLNMRAQVDNPTVRAKLAGQFRDIMSRLPVVHHDVVEFLLGHLYRVSQHESENKMGPGQLGTVFSPSFFGSGPAAGSGTDATKGHMQNLHLGLRGAQVIEMLLLIYDELFVDDTELPAPTVAPSTPIPYEEYARTIALPEPPPSQQQQKQQQQEGEGPQSYSKTAQHDLAMAAARIANARRSNASEPLLAVDVIGNDDSDEEEAGAKEQQDHNEMPSAPHTPGGELSRTLSKQSSSDFVTPVKRVLSTSSTGSPVGSPAAAPQQALSPLSMVSPVGGSAPARQLHLVHALVQQGVADFLTPSTTSRTATVPIATAVLHLEAAAAASAAAEETQKQQNAVNWDSVSPSHEVLYHVHKPKAATGRRKPSRVSLVRSPDHQHLHQDEHGAALDTSHTDTSRGVAPARERRRVTRITTPPNATAEAAAIPITTTATTTTVSHSHQPTAPDLPATADDASLVLEYRALVKRLKAFEHAFSLEHGHTPRGPEREQHRADYNRVKELRRLVPTMSTTNTTTSNNNSVITPTTTEHDASRTTTPHNMSTGALDITALPASASASPVAPSLFDIASMDANELFQCAQSRLEHLRRSQSRPDDLASMNHAQLGAEKLSIKNILREYDVEFERQSGRAPNKNEKEALRPLYQRYKRVKTLSEQLEQPQQQEQEGNSEAQQATRTGDTLNYSQAGTLLATTTLARTSTHTLVLDDVASMGSDEVVQRHAQVKAKKRELQSKLHRYECEFEEREGRKVSTAGDRAPVLAEYAQYAELKAQLAALTSRLSASNASNV